MSAIDTMQIRVSEYKEMQGEIDHLNTVVNSVNSVAKEIYKLIPQAIEKIGAIAKNGNNTHQNYKFRSIDDMYNKIQPVLPTLGLFFIPQVLEKNEEIFESGNGKRSIRVAQRVKYMICAKDGSMIEAIVWGEAIDTSDKATNKSLTAAFKYVLIQVFCIAIEGLDDADKESPEVPVKKVTSAPKPTITEDMLDEDEPDLGEYVVKTGKKYDGQKLKDIDMFQLDGYMKFLADSEKKNGRPLTGAFLEFYKAGEAYLKQREFKR